MKRNFLFAPAAAGLAVLAVTASAYACTTFRGELIVNGTAAGTAAVTATGDNSSFMVQTVSANVAKTTHSATAATVKVSTASAGGTNVLAAATYDINFFNSNAGATVVGYNTHTTWSTDCMDDSNNPGFPLNGTKLGTVTTNAAGTITGQTGGSLAAGIVTYTNAPAPNTDSGTNESAVCITDSTGGVGNQAPITIV